MAFIIKKTIRRLWDGGASYEFCPAPENKKRYWENRKAAHVFKDNEQPIADQCVAINAEVWPGGADEEIEYENIFLTEKAAANQRRSETQPQFIKGRSSKWKKPQKQ